MTPLETLREIYFKASPSTIATDFDRAIDAFKQLTTDEDREKAAVFMEGIAEMRQEFAGRSKKAAGTGARPPARKPRR
ncbi:MAG TPA: hypothetical protein VMF13_13045 [Luteitalea sp.]|nr:hypothetical protein [Luteitalea sp.]